MLSDEKIKKLEEEIDRLKTRRVLQQDILPDVVKMRHIGEGVRYIRGGVSAGRPTIGEEPLQGCAVWFDETTSELYIWNKLISAWVLVALT